MHSGLQVVHGEILAVNVNLNVVGNDHVLDLTVVVHFHYDIIPRDIHDWIAGDQRHHGRLGPSKNVYIVGFDNLRGIDTVDVFLPWDFDFNDVGGAFASQGFNLIGQTNYIGGWLPSDLVGGGGTPLNPNLGALTNNGGPTLTHIPLPGSFAIDNGTNAGCPVTDQRGQPRPAGLACDVGAVERQGFDFPFRYLYLPLIRK